MLSEHFLCTLLPFFHSFRISSQTGYKYWFLALAVHSLGIFKQILCYWTILAFIVREPSVLTDTFLRRYSHLLNATEWCYEVVDVRIRIILAKLHTNINTNRQDVTGTSLSTPPSPNKDYPLKRDIGKVILGGRVFRTTSYSQQSLMHTEIRGCI